LTTECSFQLSSTITFNTKLESQKSTITSI